MAGNALPSLLSALDVAPDWPDSPAWEILCSNAQLGKQILESLKTLSRHHYENIALEKRARSSKSGAKNRSGALADEYYSQLQLLGRALLDLLCALSSTRWNGCGVAPSKIQRLRGDVLLGLSVAARSLSAYREALEHRAGLQQRVRSSSGAGQRNCTNTRRDGSTVRMQRKSTKDCAVSLTETSAPLPSLVFKPDTRIPSRVCPIATFSETLSSEWNSVEVSQPKSPCSAANPASSSASTCEEGTIVTNHLHKLTPLESAENGIDVVSGTSDADGGDSESEGIHRHHVVRDPWAPLVSALADEDPDKTMQALQNMIENLAKVETEQHLLGQVEQQRQGVKDESEEQPHDQVQEQLEDQQKKHANEDGECCDGSTEQQKRVHSQHHRQEDEKQPPHEAQQLHQEQAQELHQPLQKELLQQQIVQQHERHEERVPEEQVNQLSDESVTLKCAQDTTMRMTGSSRWGIVPTPHIIAMKMRTVRALQPTHQDVEKDKSAFSAEASRRHLDPAEKKFPYAVLKRTKQLDWAPPDGVDPKGLENYLSDFEFQSLFGTTREAFTAQPLWRQQAKKKELALF